MGTAARSVPAGTLSLARGRARGLAGRGTAGRRDGRRASGRATPRAGGSRWRGSASALGGAFLSVGVLWLVASNLDRLSPGVRFGGVVLVWLAAVVGAEAARRAPARALRSPPLRLLGAAAFGGVVFQAAQSLQVPAYAPHLLGTWAAGALLQAYAVRRRRAAARRARDRHRLGGLGGR